MWSNGQLPWHTEPPWRWKPRVLLNTSHWEISHRLLLLLTVLWCYLVFLSQCVRECGFILQVRGARLSLVSRSQLNWQPLGSGTAGRQFVSALSSLSCLYQEVRHFERTWRPCLALNLQLFITGLFDQTLDLFLFYGRHIKLSVIGNAVCCDFLSYECLKFLVHYKHLDTNQNILTKFVLKSYKMLQTKADFRTCLCVVIIFYEFVYSFNLYECRLLTMKAAGTIQHLTNIETYSVITIKGEGVQKASNQQ